MSTVPKSLDEGDRPGSYAIPRLGVDGRGFTHYYHDRKHVAIVYDEDGEVEREADLGDRTVKEWVKAVEKEYGWKQYPGDWVAILSDALEAEEDDA